MIRPVKEDELDLNELDYYKPYLTYRELFGQRIPLSDIANVIRDKVHTVAVLSILSQLSFVGDLTTSSVFKGDFVKLILNLVHDSSRQTRDARVRELKNLIEQRVVIFEQGLLNLWKMVILYGKNPEECSEQVNFAEQYELTLKLLLALSDHYTSSNSPSRLLTELFQNAVFNHRPEFGHTLARTLLIYSSIVKDRSLFREKEYLDIRRKFEETYQFTIEQYISTLFGLFSIFTKTIQEHKNRTDVNWFQNINFTFKQTNLRYIAIDVMDSLTFSKEIGESGIQDHLSNWWDFGFLFDKPLYRVKDSVIPVSRFLLENAFTELLYWKIRKCYPQNDMSFQTFYGRPFEIYVQELVRRSCSVGKVPYEFIPEFSYPTPKGEDRSPDCMVRLGNKLWVIEAKSQRLNFKRSVIQGDADSIEKDRVDMTVAPIKEQSYKRVMMLLSGITDKVDLSGIDEIFFMVVNQGMFPTIRFFENETLREYKELDGITQKVHFYHVSIEEFEGLVGFLEKRKPIFRLLAHKENFPYFDFRNFFVAQNLKIKMPSYIKDELSNLENFVRQQMF